MKLEICSFSGYKIYPGRGKLYVRQDSRVFRLLSAKVESLFLQRKNPRKIHWTVVFRKMHKKGITEEAAKKRSRKTVKYQRAVVGATWDKIMERRNQKPEERKAARDEAVQKAKEAKKAADAKKKAEKAKLAAASGKSQPKGPKNVKQAGRAPAKGQASSKR